MGMGTAKQVNTDEVSESSEPVPNIQTLRDAIPKSCFQGSLSKSLGYVVRDLALVGALGWAALGIRSIDDNALRWLLWVIYGFVQGLVMTGIWILAHECGHQAFSPYRKLNSCIGFALHSFLMVPFFSWKYTHARHHRYANNMEKDTAHVPPRKDDYLAPSIINSILGHGEDSPLLNMFVFVGHQLIGWPMYLFFNITAGSRSLISSSKAKSVRQSHFDPTSDMFTASEHPFVLISDVGLGITIFGLWKLSCAIGSLNTFLLYGLPYLWVNHWIVAITFLHHNHEDTPHYEAESWTFQKGALATIDRDFGFIGRHLFHGIIEYHVVHHLFPRIPFYHAEEATRAIAPLLGQHYREQRSSFLVDLYTTFCSLKFVEADEKRGGILRWRGSSQTPKPSNYNFPRWFGMIQGRR